jgi:hypothetical protein
MYFQFYKDQLLVGFWKVVVGAIDAKMPPSSGGAGCDIFFQDYDPASVEPVAV